MTAIKARTIAVGVQAVASAGCQYRYRNPTPIHSVAYLPHAKHGPPQWEVNE
jgi:hypothetical protein